MSPAHLALGASLVGLLAGCAAPHRAPPPTPHSTRHCGSHVEPMWNELARVVVARPDTPVTLTVALPEGMSLPPRAVDTGDRCSAVGGIRALSGIALERCCGDGAHHAGFERGCRSSVRCYYRDAEGHEATTPTELARLLAPIDTRERALALVALLHGDLLDPAWLAEGAESPYGFEAIADAPSPYEIVPSDDGFTVRAPAYAGCGCDHHLLRVAFAVSRDGCVTRLAEPLVPLAWSAGLCVD